MHIFYFNTVILVIKIKERRKKRAEVLGECREMWQGRALQAEGNICANE